MGESANPSGSREAARASCSLQGARGDGAGRNPSNHSAAVTTAENSASAQALKHNPGLAVEWSPEEQSILDEGLAEYASESNIVRYAKIALQLQEKTVRDVALRCRWMKKKESSKRKKDDHNLSKKNNKKGVSDLSAKVPTHIATQPSMPPYSLPMLPIDNDDEVSLKGSNVLDTVFGISLAQFEFSAIGGATGQILEQNTQHFNQISSNLSSYQIHDNINLFCQIRENIFTILKDMDDVSGVMKQMPPLPVKLNEELANSILPRRNSKLLKS